MGLWLLLLASHKVPASRSRWFAVHSDSISTCPRVALPGLVKAPESPRHCVSLAASRSECKDKSNGNSPHPTKTRWVGHLSLACFANEVRVSGLLQSNQRGGRSLRSDFKICDDHNRGSKVWDHCASSRVGAAPTLGQQLPARAPDDGKFLRGSIWSTVKAPLKPTMGLNGPHACGNCRAPLQSLECPDLRTQQQRLAQQQEYP